MIVKRDIRVLVSFNKINGGRYGYRIGNLLIKINRQTVSYVLIECYCWVKIRSDVFGRM